MNKITRLLVLTLLVALVSTTAGFSQGPPSVRVTSVNPSSGTAPVTPVVTYTASVPMTVSFSINGSRVGQASAAMGTNTWTFPALTTPGTYTLTVSCPGGSSSGTCTVNAPPPPPPPPAISISPTSASVGYSSTSTQIMLSSGSSSVSWTATPSGCVTQVSPKSGNQTPGPPTSINVIYGANTGAARSGTVSFSAPGATSQTFTLTQAAAPPAVTISVQSPPSGTVGPLAPTINYTVSQSGTLTFYVNSIAQTPISASGSNTWSPGTLQPGTYSFYATISNGNGSGTSNTISGYVIKTAPPTISLSTNTLSVGYSSGTTTFNISNSGGGTLNWSVLSNNPDWLTVSPSSGTVTVTYAANTGSARIGTITVSDPNATNSPQTVTVNQGGTPKSLMIIKIF